MHSRHTTGILQKAMQDIFGHLGDWCYLLFDNVLLGGTSYQDCYDKIHKFLDVARAANVYLKLEKSWFGLKEVKFFGYKVYHRSKQRISFNNNGRASARM